MDQKDWQKIMRTMGLLTQLGIVVIVNIGIGFYLGLKLDLWLGYNYLFKILGLIIGTGAGFYSDYQLLRNYIKEDEDD